MSRIAIAAVTIAWALAQAAPVPAQEVVRVAWVKALVAGPLLIAREKGYFRDAGLNVELELASSSSNLMPMLATGRLNVLEGGVQANIFGAIAQGLPIIIAGDRASEPTGHHLLIRPALKDVVKSIADLKGRTISVGSGLSISHFELDRILSRAGLSLKDVELRNNSVPQLGAAFSNGAVDAGIVYTPFTYLLPARNLAVKLLEVDDHLKKATGGVTMINTDWAKRRPDEARRFFVALARGIRDFCQAYHHGSHRAEVQAILTRTEVVDDPELFKHFWGSRKASGEADVENIFDVYDWLVRNGSVAGGLTREQLVDNSFARAANAALGPFVIENRSDTTPGCE